MHRIPLASLNRVSMTYSNSTDSVTPIKNVSLDICRGDFISICGVSGSGKSTLLNILAGLITPSEGTVLYNGRVDISKLSDRKKTLFRRRNIGIVFQDMNLLANMTARENIIFPLLLDNVAINAETEMKIRRIIAMFGLEKLAGHYPFEMSGGEQQRTAIARAILPAALDSARHTLVLADEPTGNLDGENAENIGKLLQRLNNEGQTIVLATHDKALASKARTQLEIQNGTIRFM